MVLGEALATKPRPSFAEQLDQTWAKFESSGNSTKKVQPQSVEEGYARLDALNRIGNQVFSLDLRKEFDNYVGLGAGAFSPHLECPMVCLGPV